MKVGDMVFWKWGNGFAEAEIQSIAAKPTSIESKGKLITRNGSKADPALVLKTAKGVLVLKLAHEVKKSKPNNSN